MGKLILVLGALAFMVDTAPTGMTIEECVALLNVLAKQEWEND